MIQDFSSDYLRFRVNKEITRLYKSFLLMIDEARKENDAAAARLQGELPDDYHNLIRVSNWLDDNKFKTYRKKILDEGNQAARDIIEELDKFDIAPKTN